MKSKHLFLIPVVAGVITSTACTATASGGASILSNLLQALSTPANNTTATAYSAPQSSGAVAGTSAVSISGRSAPALLERIFVTHIRAMNQNVSGQAAVAELNRYMDKIIEDTKTLNVLVERMSPGEKASFAVLLKSYLERHLSNGSAYTDVHTASMLANPAKYGIFRGYFRKMMSMLPQPA